MSAATDGFRILIVEDNPHIVEMYAYALRKLALDQKIPVEVEFAADGHTALAQLLGKRFHLLLTDLYMPVMDGFALIERLREDQALEGIPVVAISAGGREARDRAIELGVEAFLRKPVRFVDVLATVKQILHLG